MGGVKQGKKRNLRFKKFLQHIQEVAGLLPAEPEAKISAFKLEAVILGCQPAMADG
jgi:hypothetical protein